MIHKNYLLLDKAEKDFLDNLISEAFDQSPEAIGFRLLGDDSAEIAVEAIATWFLESKRYRETQEQKEHP